MVLYYLAGQLINTDVARQPAIKRAGTHVFERVQEPECHDFTRPQSDVGMFGDVVQVRIDPTE